MIRVYDWRSPLIVAVIFDAYTMASVADGARDGFDSPHKRVTCADLSCFDWLYAPHHSPGTTVTSASDALRHARRLPRPIFLLGQSDRQRAEQTPERPSQTCWASFLPPFPSFNSKHRRAQLQHRPATCPSPRTKLPVQVAVP